MKFWNTCLKLCFAVLAGGIPFASNAQNLVPNGSFEQYTTCPVSSLMSYCVGWKQFTGGTSDYLHTCAGTIPTNSLGYQVPAQGNAYAGVLTYWGTLGDYKEYIAAGITPLQIGMAYEVSMSISLANTSGWATNDLGVFFYDKPRYYTSNGTLPVTPQISYSSYGTPSDTLDWMRITAAFTADSTYDTIVIGGYKNYSVMTKNQLGTNSWAYYYIDSVVIRPFRISTFYYDTILCKGDTFDVPYVAATGYLNPGNVISIQLSDQSGSFLNPTTVGSVTTTTSGIVKGVIPGNVATGTGYRIRIVSSNPNDSSIGNGKDLIIAAGPTLTASSNAPLCPSDTLKLSSSTTNIGVSYKWVGPNGFTSFAKDTNVLNFSPANAGDYIVTAKLGWCSTKDTATVTTKPLPAKPTAGSNTPVCPGTTLNLTASTSTSGVTWSWTGPAGFNASIQNPGRSNMQTNWAGNYIVTANLNGCTAKDTETVTSIITTPTPSATNNSPVCVGGFLNLTASNVTNASYLWTGPNGFSSTQQNPVRNNVSGFDAGVYSVTANVNGCISLPGMTTATVVPGPSVSTYVNPGDTICIGDTAKFVALPFNAGSMPTYQWYKNGNLIPGATMTPYVTNNIADGDLFYVLMTAGTVCNTPIQSNSIKMNVIQKIGPTSVKITVAPDSVVWAGLQLTFTAVSVNCRNPQYQWKRNGIDIVGGTVNPLPANHLSNGDKISCVVTCFCGDPGVATSNTIKLSIDTKVDDPSHRFKMAKVYPNPVTNQLTIEGIERGTVISISDITGRELFSTTSTQSQELIDMRTFSAGTYMLHLQTPDGYRMNMKLVKE
jgi:hypothetical protein